MGLKIILFIDCNGNIIIKEKITSMPLKEECIIKKSIEFFNDCEPCIIHRTYIMKRIYMEIDDYLNKMIAEGKKEIIAEYLPTDILRVIDIKEQPYKIIINI
jgi:hypothetical protein